MTTSPPFLVGILLEKSSAAPKCRSCTRSYCLAKSYVLCVYVLISVHIKHCGTGTSSMAFYVLKGGSVDSCITSKLLFMTVLLHGYLPKALLWWRRVAMVMPCCNLCMCYTCIRDVRNLYFHVLRFLFACVILGSWLQETTLFSGSCPSIWNGVCFYLFYVSFRWKYNSRLSFAFRSEMVCIWELYRVIRVFIII